LRIAGADEFDLRAAALPAPQLPVQDPRAARVDRVHRRQIDMQKLCAFRVERLHGGFEHRRVRERPASAQRHARRRPVELGLGPNRLRVRKLRRGCHLRRRPFFACRAILVFGMRGGQGFGAASSPEGGVMVRCGILTQFF